MVGGWVNCKIDHVVIGGWVDTLAGAWMDTVQHGIMQAGVGSLPGHAGDGLLCQKLLVLESQPNLLPLDIGQKSALVVTVCQSRPLLNLQWWCRC